MPRNKVEDEISIELVNKNHKSDQIITHHPSSQNHIIKLERLNQKSNERNFDPTNHHKIPKHDYMINADK